MMETRWCVELTNLPMTDIWSSCWATMGLSSRGFSKLSCNTLPTDSSLEVMYALVIYKSSNRERGRVDKTSAPEIPIKD